MTPAPEQHSTTISGGTRPDLVVVARVVHTLDPELGDVEALAIRDGVVVAAGGRDVAETWADGGVRVIDLGDAAVTPGLVDAHLHPISGLELARGVDLSGCEDLDAVAVALAEAAAGVGADDWVSGWGLDPNVFGTTEPHGGVLDDALGGRPAFVMLFDAHSAIVSRAALNRAGIAGEREFSDASRIVVDASGSPTGLLLENEAMRLVESIKPTESFDERVAHLVAVLEGMAGTGITAGHVMDMHDDDAIAVLEAVEARGELPIRLRISPMCVPGMTDVEFDAFVSLQGRRGRRWAIEGVKLMIDGTIDNGTAWLREPDTRGESTASLWLDPAEYAGRVAELHDRGIPTATHAIGDKAIEVVVRTLAALPRTGVQHRVEHVETLPDDVLAVFAEAGIAASMQPTHCTHYTRADQTDNWSVRLGPERADRAWRIGDLRAAGVTVALGSDWPVAPYDARASIADAILRRPALKPHVAPVLPDQAVSALQALEGYTTHAFASIGAVGGTLAIGAPADLTAFAVDPLDSDPDDFAASAVLLTLVDGVPVIGADERVDA
ncbi:amidohydrolase [Labedella phragmitis]|uniref:amidohydrolase n=1 Tax=Labedella phragmitis TaxID=2498849 RepID=UPI001FB6DCAA|nr:amidohydrolase [Labedella phragmitis]